MNTNIHIDKAKYSPNNIDYVDILNNIRLVDIRNVANINEIDRVETFKANGQYEIEPNDPFDGLKKVTVHVDVPQQIIKPTEILDIDLNANIDRYEINGPIENININILNRPDTSKNILYCWENKSSMKNPYIWTSFDIAPDDYEKVDPDTGDVIKHFGCGPDDLYIRPTNDYTYRITKAAFKYIDTIVDKYRYVKQDNNTMTFSGSNYKNWPEARQINIVSTYKRTNDSKLMDIDLSKLLIRI